MSRRRDVPVMRWGARRWLALEPHQWSAEAEVAPGRLLMQIVAVTRTSVPGLVEVRGWRHTDDPEETAPKWVTIRTRVEMLRRATW